MTVSVLPTQTDVRAAMDRIGPYIRHTPVLRAEVDAREVVFKLDHLQRSGSFKLRGAFNALLSDNLPSRVVAASGGNHGLAVATAAAVLGLPATVYVPEKVPASKARRIIEAGAKLVRCADLAAAFTEAARVTQADPTARYVHPYADPAVITGQGTVVLEAVSQVPDIDSVAVAVGGGGLAAGAVLAAGERPVVAVEPQGCRCLREALIAGEPVDAPVESVASSALGAHRVGEANFAILNTDTVRSVLVTDQELLAARDGLWEEFRLAVEPAAAAPFAAWLAGQVPGELACIVLCGANTNWSPED